jgi:hypothetical protein
MSTRRCPADIWLFCGFPSMRRQAGLETSLATTANGRKKLDPKTATVAPYGHWGRYFAIRKSRLALLDRRRRLSGLLQLVSACESVKTGQLCSAAVQLGRIWNAVTTRFSKNIARVVNRQLCAVCRIKMSKTDQSLASVTAILLESANTRCVPARSTDALQCNEQIPLDTVLVDCPQNQRIRLVKSRNTSLGDIAGRFSERRFLTMTEDCGHDSV